MRLISRRSFLGDTAKLSAAGFLPLAIAQRSDAAPQGRQTVLQQYMRDVHAWHNRTFFDFDAHLAAVEKRYIAACVDVMDARAHRINRNFFYSTCTYSHRVSGTSANSARLAYGSIRHRAALRAPMAEVLRHRGIAAKEIGNLEQAFGIGWDVPQDHVKVYIHLPSLRSIEDADVARLAQKPGEEARYDFGLVSYTFAGGKLHEKKVYVALKSDRPEPVRGYPFEDLIRHTNYMVTDRRGVVPQVDLAPGSFDGRYLNAKGQEICAKYREAVGRTFTAPDARVDTLTYKSPDEFTLYF
jgi:hypothetical protein